MAEVYRGRAFGEEGFEKPVAIKRILPHFAKDARFVTMLLTEARIHAALSHKNIVQIHDLGISEEGEYFIVLEYVDGPDLSMLLDKLAKPTAAHPDRRRLPDAIALHIIIELGEGTHFAHELVGPDGVPLGLIHRDISPSNVLLSYAGEVKLSDFGLAKRRTDHSVVGSLKGKLAYMSPEQARRSTLDRRSDIFALGAVLFELLTGQRLREITDDVVGWQQVASGLIPPISRFRGDLPSAVERLLTRALAPNPRDRYTDAQSFVEEARAALDRVPRTAAGETVDLGDALRTHLPPGAPRSLAEPSKVIRLVSEFLTGDLTVRRETPGTTSSSAPAAAPVRRQPPRAPGMTPALPSPPIGPVRNVAPMAAPKNLAPPVVPAARPRTPSAAFPAAAPPASGHAQTIAPAPVLSGAFRSTPYSTPAAHSSPYAAPPMRPILSWAEPAPASIARQVFWAALFLVPIIAGVIHWAFVPLPILGVWRQPARVEIASMPPGARVFLDGRPLPAPTPTFAEVKRDRESHVVELQREGYQIAKRVIRYDRTQAMSVSVPLTPESRPLFRPIPSETNAEGAVPNDGGASPDGPSP